MPIIIALERAPGQLEIQGNASIFEFTPWELGSFAPETQAFAPLQYIGSGFVNGSIPNGNQCVTGVDNVGFVVGTSSSLFNQAFIQITNTSDAPDFLVKSINDTLAQVGQENRDIASWPNPFYKYRMGYNRNANFTTLTLVDGGETWQNIPLHPLLMAQRNVDVVLVIDSSADTTSAWPNGTSLVMTEQQSVAEPSTYNTTFSPIPDQNTIINLGLNHRPTFFGCIIDTNKPGPLLVYLPNAPYSYYSNVSTFELKFTTDERNNIIQNGYNVATMGNSTVDSSWPVCLSCAILSRSFNRTQTQPPRVCQECFGRFCWNGTVNSSKPKEYEPSKIIVPTSTGHLVLISPCIWVFIASLYLLVALI
jgi:lysophospholipase